MKPIKKLEVGCKAVILFQRDSKKFIAGTGVEVAYITPAKTLAIVRRDGFAEIVKIKDLKSL